ncbi:hypothetical protein OROMI_018696 [Orobanche minor]
MEMQMNQEEPSRQKRKRTRGPRVCKDVHEWTLDECKTIIISEIGKAIGPDKKKLDKFSSFLGTLARKSSLAPLNKISWHYVGDKDNIWNYVKKKYNISEERKDHVLASVGKLWHKCKHSVKENHFSANRNDADRKKA